MTFQSRVLLTNPRILSIHKMLPPESLSDDQTPCTTQDFIENFPSSLSFSLEEGAKWLRFAQWTYFYIFFTCKIFISHITYITFRIFSASNRERIFIYQKNYLVFSTHWRTKLKKQCEDLFRVWWLRVSKLEQNPPKIVLVLQLDVNWEFRMSL